MSVSLRRFLGDVERMDQRRKQKLGNVIRGVGDRLAGEVILGGTASPGTPKDKGFAQNSWVVGLNGTVAFRQPAAPPKDLVSVDVVSREEATAAIAKVITGDRFTLESNCVYIGRLERGHSQQAPTGMVGLALAGFQRIVAEVVAEVRSQR